ncbi:MAG: helix-turn-helix domain-containing protein [Magnetococcales bacterium]|nr:helix-turn-helix domain-containing protein [Magnetococcales bacterium]
MNLGDRIQIARKAAGLTQKELADRVGISQTAVHKLECGRSKSSRKTVTIALTCGVDPVWLETGHGEMSLSPAGVTPQDTATRGVSDSDRPYPTRGYLVTRLPLLSWIEASSQGAPQDQVGDERTWVSLGQDVNQKAFALQVSGDSMATEFTDGDIIVVDPDARAENNHFVVARLIGEDKATFKQLIIDGGRQYLKPLNSRYPIIEIDNRATICGVVVCKYKEY